MGYIEQLYLSYNELTLEDDNIGLYSTESETTHYFSYSSLGEGNWHFWAPEYDFEFQILMSQNKKVEKRKAYTLFTLLSDIGGFNDGLYMMISIPLSFYSSAMYSRHIANLFTVRPKQKGRRKKDEDPTLSIIASGECSSSKLKDKEK